MPATKVGPTCCGSRVRTASRRRPCVSVFIPLHDTNPLKSIDHQYVTFALIALNVAVFVIFQTGWGIALENETAALFPATPADLLGPTAKTVISPTFPMPE